MKHYINQESYLLVNTSKKTYLAVFILSILLATTYTVKASTIDNLKILNKIDSCTSIAVHYIENGKYNAGDSELLYMNLSIDEQKAKAKKFVIDSEKVEMTNSKGDCNIKIAYKL
jgi:hypothetical protein